MAHSTSPPLDADDAVALLHHSQLDGFSNTPLQALVNILLPVGAVEVWFTLWKAEWVHATVEMGISRGTLVSSNHDDWADWSILG